MVNDSDVKGKHKGQGANKMLVKYGRLALLGWFEHHETSIPKTPTKVIIKTERGLEMGEIVGCCQSYRSGNFKGVADLAKYFEVQKSEYPIGAGGTFVRIATPEDISEEKHIQQAAKEEFDICKRIAREMRLDMKMVDYEHIFGGERIIFYFVADGRVDFRELVKRLAREFQTRIEMRQIGARDEARLISDLETCGQPCCCSRFLKILKPVNMRMAKMQKATLDPSKISGHCGRLRCCLRYEDECYKDLKKRLPNKNTIVETPMGEGRVIDHQIMTQLVRVQLTDGKMEVFPVDNLDVQGQGRKKDAAQAPDAGKKPEGADNRPEAETRSKGRKAPEKSGYEYNFETIETEEVVDLADEFKSRRSGLDYSKDIDSAKEKNAGRRKPRRPANAEKNAEASEQSGEQKKSGSRSRRSRPRGRRKPGTGREQAAKNQQADNQNRDQQSAGQPGGQTGGSEKREDQKNAQDGKPRSSRPRGRSRGRRRPGPNRGDKPQQQNKPASDNPGGSGSQQD